MEKVAEIKVFCYDDVYMLSKALKIKGFTMHLIDEEPDGWVYRIFRKSR